MSYDPQPTASHFIDGAWTEVGDTFESRNPATGEVLAYITQGTPGDVMTSDILSRAYGCVLHVGQIPPPGTPFVLPHLAALAAE